MEFIRKTILMFCLLLNPVPSEQLLPEIQAESGNGGRAQLSVSPVSPQLQPELSRRFCGVHVCVGTQYLHSAVTLPPGACLISHVPGSGGR